jgi:protein-S-isoprenylcysteine O-methyltransferase Ste14
MVEIPVRSENQALDGFGRSRVIQLVAGCGVFAALLFGSAGRFDWLPAWLFIILFTAFVIGITVWALRRDPALLNERGRAFSKEIPLRERLLVSGVSLIQLAIFVVAGLDAGRWQWSVMPPVVQIAGWLLLIPAVILGTGALTANTYASVAMRIQTDRGHQVVTGGPYRFVRHPMYVAVLCYAIGTPLALGSWWALIPGGLVALAFIFRTAAEDRMLRRDLPGYADYAQQTRYRLLPGVW